MKKPLIIYVSGAPGAGKSTLAQKISDELYIPRISSDLIHGGVRFSEGKKNDRKESFFQAFLPTIKSMAQNNISFVIDHVLQQSISENDVIYPLQKIAKIVYIHVEAKDAIKRHVSRELSRTDKGIVLNRREIKERAAFHESNLHLTATPLRLELPTLIVNTDEGYQPDFAHIIRFIEMSYEKER